jgi:hypothetical protein
MISSRPGRKAFMLQSPPPVTGDRAGESLAKAAGFSLHAGVATEAHQRNKLERSAGRARRRGGPAPCRRDVGAALETGFSDRRDRVRALRRRDEDHCVHRGQANGSTDTGAGGICHVAPRPSYRRRAARPISSDHNPHPCFTFPPPLHHTSPNRLPADLRRRGSC